VGGGGGGGFKYTTVRKIRGGGCHLGGSGYGKKRSEKENSLGSAG